MQPTEPPMERPQARRPTQLLRDILDTSEEFEQHVGRTLSVNATDLEAMEHLIMSGPLPPTELSRRLNISTPAVTAVIDRLIGVGHVTRAQHPTDRRSIVVVPNPRSVETAMATLMPMIMGIDSVLDNFDDDEKDVIERYLDQVVAIYRAQLPEPADVPAPKPAVAPPKIDLPGPRRTSWKPENHISNGPLLP
ncbi:MarR family winged helix-turn-helix transcriptional regulator [Salinibacterium sp. SWN248]|uniref:MarR family winged helix-turn-helix transcriptional regulator n=1 Tax=Salinibacterium sp. SWN248 TaxID=2792056 RepID=UPI0018CE9554|nr:MarR family transcriptional regulator [Salinibacterium sp. SWN248]MBH0023724.1 MarR family transcriptional regulator [Salinibacterium sp. SWN248]